MPLHLFFVFREFHPTVFFFGTRLGQTGSPPGGIGHGRIFEIFLLEVYIL